MILTKNVSLARILSVLKYAKTLYSPYRVADGAENILLFFKVGVLERKTRSSI